ncbi:MAG TPA: hypothetical protein VN890_10255 [Methylocella sp.]|nr:hypothetical protein [Methylocella sp.]
MPDSFYKATPRKVFLATIAKTISYWEGRSSHHAAVRAEITARDRNSPGSDETFDGAKP